MSRPGGLADERRLLRLIAPAALAALVAAIAGRLDSDSPALWLAGLGSAAALWLVLRHPRPAGTPPDRPGALHRTGRVLLLAGLALLLAGLVASRGGEQQARIGALCEGQSAQMGNWNLKLERVTPVAGEGFTAIEASFRASREQGLPMLLEPQLRSSWLPGAAPDPASRVALWSGDLELVLSRFDPVTGCLAITASWLPLAGAARSGGWLAVFGALLMAMVALSSLRWRIIAGERIAMRREERPLPTGQSTAKARRIWPLVGLLLALCLAAWLAFGSPAGLLRPAASVATPAFTRGSTLVAARQSLLDGPANTNRWIVIADALARRGQFSNASELLLGAIEANPRDPDGWLALGDALYGHAGGRLTPAAVLAYDRADRAALARGAMLPPTGLAMEASERGELAQMWWRRHLSRPAGSVALRAAITARLNYSAP